MKNICYLLVTMFLNENGKTGHQNVYVNVKGDLYCQRLPIVFVKIMVFKK